MTFSREALVTIGKFSYKNSLISNAYQQAFLALQLPNHRLTIYKPQPGSIIVAYRFAPIVRSLLVANAVHPARLRNRCYQSQTFCAQNRQPDNSTAPLFANGCGVLLHKNNFAKHYQFLPAPPTFAVQI